MILSNQIFNAHDCAPKRGLPIMFWDIKINRFGYMFDEILGKTYAAEKL